jgi:hypothetical protein
MFNQLLESIQCGPSIMDHIFFINFLDQSNDRPHASFSDQSNVNQTTLDWSNNEPCGGSLMEQVVHVELV